MMRRRKADVVDKEPRPFIRMKDFNTGSHVDYGILIDTEGDQTAVITQECSEISRIDLFVENPNCAAIKGHRIVRSE